MEAEALQTEHVAAKMSQREVTPKNTFLVEWCCEKDSHLMQEWRRQGGQGLRVVLPDFDAAKDGDIKKIVRMAKERMRRGYHVRLHASLPCNMWSS